MEIKFWLTHNTYTDLRSLWYCTKVLLFVRYLAWKHNSTPEAMLRMINWAKKTGRLD